jgi:polar amino acid transport system substrate-binding protein
MAVIQEYEVEIRNYDFDFLFSAIQSSKIDLIASATSLTKERLKVLDASEPYWQFDQGLLVREDSKININTALTAGNIIGINRKTLESDRIKETISSKNIQLELYEKDTLGILDLLNKRIDAFVTDFPIAKIFARDNPINIIGTIDNKEQLVKDKRGQIFIIDSYIF